MSKPTWKKKPLVSAMPRAWALEPRLMFDAAAAATATEHVADASARAAAEAQTAAAAARDSAAAHTAEAQPAARQEVVFVDSGITDYQALLRALPAGAEVVMLDANRNGFEQMAQYLQGRQGLDAIHLISEGERGAVRAGSALLDLGTTSAHAAELQRIGAALSDSGDLLLYGCNVGQGSEGAALLEQLATLTQADIAASTNWSGSADRGADWELEARVGSVESAVAIDTWQAQAYGERLGVSPTITSATYNASTGELKVTGSSMTAGDTIDVSKLTLTGEGGSTYTLTSANVTASSSTAFSVTLNATDKAAFNLIANRAGTTSTGGTSFNLAAANGWDVSRTSDADASNALTVSNVPVPTITNATYDHYTGVLTVIGTGFLKRAGSNNDIDVSKLTLRGQGNATYTLTSSSVEINGDGTTFTVQLNTADKTAAITLLNKNGSSSVGNTAYNLAAGAGWATGADANVNVTDTSNAVTVSGVPSITSASYDINTGVLTVTGSSFFALDGSNNDIDVSKLTLTGQGNQTYTLTSSKVDITSSTTFSVVLNAADKTGVSTLFNKNGTNSAGGTAYNLAAAEDWAAGAPTAMIVADLTGNALAVSGLVTYTQLNFGVAQFESVVGNGTHNGDVVIYRNVVAGVDAVITTSELSAGTTITEFDSPGTPGSAPNNFQPLLQVNTAGGGVTFTFDFYVNGTYNTSTRTGMVATLANVLINSYDIDSTGGTNRQYQDFKGFTRYELANSSATTIGTTVLSNGSVRFEALTAVNNLNNLYEDQYRVRAFYDTMSSFQIRTGVNYDSAPAHFSLEFNVGPDWKSPTTVVDTPASRLTYSPTNFVEADANDGSITTTSMITLVPAQNSNVTFTGTNGESFGTDKVIVGNVPAGLSAKVTRVDATHVQLSFTGSAVAHANANDLSNVTVTFGNTAFSTGNASAVTGYSRSDLSIDFNDPPPNAAPDGADKTITVLEDGSHTFAAADFGFTDSDGHALQAVKITSVPAAGTLTLNGTAVAAGTTVAAADIALLRFAPAPNASGNGYASFTFQVQDNGGTDNGGSDLDATPNTITVNVTPVNDAPAGADKTITVLEDGSHTFAAADFGFTDSDGHALQAVRSPACPRPARSRSTAPPWQPAPPWPRPTSPCCASPPRPMPAATATPASPSRCRTTAARTTAAATSTPPPTPSPSTSPRSMTPRPVPTRPSRCWRTAAIPSPPPTSASPTATATRCRR